MNHLNPSGATPSFNMRQEEYLTYLIDPTPNNPVADEKAEVPSNLSEERKNQELQEENQRLEKELRILRENYTQLAQRIRNSSSVPVQPKGLPPPVLVAERIDNAQVLLNVQKWCATIEQHLRKDTALPAVAPGVVIGDKSIAIDAFNLVADTFMKVIKIQEERSLHNIPYCEHPSLSQVRHNILTLVPISEHLRNDKTVMLTAIQISGGAFSMASIELKDDRYVALVAIWLKPEVFSCASERLRDDLDLARMAILGMCSNADDEQLQYFSFSRYNSPTLGQIRSPYLKRLYSKQLCSIKAASDRLKDDGDFVLTVIQKDPPQLQHVSKRLQDDKALVLEAVKMWGVLLQFGSARLQDDLDVVLAAVTAAANEASRNGGQNQAFEFVSARLQKDAQVLAAVAKGNEKADCVVS